MKSSRIFLTALAFFLAAGAVVSVSPAFLVEAKADMHIVQKGDTLWDISSRYLYDPFLWPRLWNVNRYIENPHLIFPGQEITVPMELAAVPRSPRPAKPALPPPPPLPQAAPPPPIVPEQIVVTEEKKQELIRAMSTYGFIIDEKEFGIGEVTKTHEDRPLISPGQKIYVTTSENASLQTGGNYSFVKVFDAIKHPVTGKKVGYLAKILGDLTVIDSRGELATSIVGEVYRPIEIGDHVMEHVKYLSWLPKEGARIRDDLEGVVLANPEGKSVMGKGDVLFLDLGTADGMRPGTTLKIVADKGTIKNPQTSSKLEPPQEIFGEVEIVVPRAKTSVARIIDSRREIQIGDKVVATAR